MKHSSADDATRAQQKRELIMAIGEIVEERADLQAKIDDLVATFVHLGRGPPSSGPSPTAVPPAPPSSRKRTGRRRPIKGSRVKITVAGKLQGRLGTVSQVAPPGKTYWTITLDNDFRGPAATTRKAITSFTVLPS